MVSSRGRQRGSGSPDTGGVVLRLCLLLLLSHFTTAPDSSSKTDARTEELRRFDYVIMTYMRDRNAPGASIAISKDGEFILRKGYGKASSSQLVSPWTLFRIGSVSKPITAVGILRLQEEGQLCLDSKVFGPGGLLPQYEPSVTGDPRLLHVTVKHLLRHNGGWDQRLAGDPLIRRDVSKLMNQSGPSDKDIIVRYMMTQALQFTPGSRFAYSNFGYLVLGRIIEQLKARSYESFMRGILWEAGVYRMKLGLTKKSEADTFEAEYYSEFPGRRVASVYPEEGLVAPPYGAFSLENMDASSGWIASPTDLVKFFDALNGTTQSGYRRRLLQEETFQEMLSAPEGEVSGENSRIWYGLGVIVQDAGRTFWHSGHLEGSTGLLAHDESGYTWAVAMNSKVENNDLADLIRYGIRKHIDVALAAGDHGEDDYVTTNLDDAALADSAAGGDNENFTELAAATTSSQKMASRALWSQNSALRASDALSRSGRNLVKVMIPDYKFMETVELLSAKNYRLSWIDAVTHRGVVYFNTIWTKSDGAKWRVFTDLSPSRYQRRFKAKLAQGYRLSYLETYVSRRRLRYAAVFVRDGWPPWVTYHGYNPRQHRDQFYRYLEQGYHLAVQSVTEYRGRIYISAIYHKVYMGEVRVRIGLTVDDFTEEIERQLKHGRILSHVQAYERRGRVKFGAVWIPQTTSAWAVTHSMTKYTLLYKMQGYADVNVPLSCVTGYVEDDVIKFAALWL